MLPPISQPKKASVEKTRVVLLSDCTPNLKDFTSALNPSVRPVLYSFASADGKSLAGLLRKQVQDNGGKRFESIALANFGSSSVSSFSWPLSARLAVSDPAELEAESESEAALFFRCLGDSVVSGGRVDVFACGLLGAARSIAALSGIRSETRTHFAGAANLDGNPLDPNSKFIMDSDGYDVKPMYFRSGGSGGGGTGGRNSPVLLARGAQEPPAFDFASLCQTMLGNDKCSAVSIYANDQSSRDASPLWGYAASPGVTPLNPAEVDAGLLANLLSTPEAELREHLKRRDIWIGGALYEFMTTTTQPRGGSVGGETLDVYLRQRDHPTKGVILATCNVCFALVYYDTTVWGQSLGMASTTVKMLRNKLAEVGL